MNDTAPSSDTGSIQPHGAEEQSALFVNLIVQHSSLAMMLMGQAPNPHGDGAAKDLQAARMFIDQLEMIEAKTKGNLTKEEEKLLKHTLMALRMSFVKAVEEDTAAPKEPVQAAKESSAPSTGDSAPPPAEEESHKKFTKKY